MSERKKRPMGFVTPPIPRYRATTVTEMFGEHYTPPNELSLRSTSSRKRSASADGKAGPQKMLQVSHKASMAVDVTSKKPSAGEDLKSPVHRFCSLPARPPPVRPSGAFGDRLALISVLGTSWANGTMLRYYFFGMEDGGNNTFDDGTTRWISWGPTDPNQMNHVREAFKTWTNTGIGVQFKEVNDRTQAELRIGFSPAEGSWTVDLGTRILRIKNPDERTMNIGWKLDDEPYRTTAVHEIGHVLGFPHEHQNPQAGIVWDEVAVLQDLAGPPNYWKHDQTYYNILRKLPAADVRGTAWDPTSIMHYPFKPALILQPENHHTSGLNPPGRLSDADIAYALDLYPPLVGVPKYLFVARSEPLTGVPGNQLEYMITPKATRKYTISTYGECDAKLVLFDASNHKYVAGADNSSKSDDGPAKIDVRLEAGKTYVLHVRLIYVATPGEASVMMTYSVT